MGLEPESGTSCLSATTRTTRLSLSLASMPFPGPGSPTCCKSWLPRCSVGPGPFSDDFMPLWLKSVCKSGTQRRRVGSTSWHLGRGPRSTRGCLEGQGAADAITSSQVPLKGTQPRLAKYPRASSSVLGRSRLHVSSFFCPALT